jgi:hypothetical protein
MITVNSREQFLIECAALLPKESNCVELGVLRGEFARKIFDIIKPNYLFLVDPYEVSGSEYDSGLTSAYSTMDDLNAVKELFKTEIGCGDVFVDKDYSYNTVKRCKDDWANFIYHDASHLYKDIKRDLNDWLPKLKQDGLMCGHDYIKLDAFGVIEAVNEFCEEHNFEMIIFNEIGGDWALRRK